MKNITTGENCGELQVALDIIVGKWKPIILFHLMENEKLRFSELQRAIPEITKKMLTSQLRELEYNDIVHRKVYQQVPPKVEYSMSPYGHGLKPLLVSMRSWGTEHLEHLEKLYGKDNEEQKEQI
ncbi:putative HTH-type transcriptional regulator YdeP [Oceanobacillus oncorhynchi subsp. incaldanensis]|uniref:Putative HTH-type transcriptional regulator YybR n=1 Tax=Oceanobacillus oncorhynchi TaxID=545501 RepID=A0A0A1MS60_9BACI|nr:helix-turn-helix transcriptional regulator [Oceanobacillus oncorhynchi]GIO21029.1 putative HTH-type transcriptional regulator YdeP [Oceanobacillus oncorhynchi subsp. incaldanensis]CEI82544.1 putative HTH-type transcriptional regulator YybR [Oceanobacillus oncorhynchi]